MSIALIVAAGSGERLGASRPKAFVELAGRPLVAWSIDALAQVAGIEWIVVALPPGSELPAAAGAGKQVIAVAGGETRSESVRRALAGAPNPAREAPDLVVVHDAARALLTPAIALSVIEALAGEPDADAAIAATPVTDTVKRVDARRQRREPQGDHPPGPAGGRAAAARPRPPGRPPAVLVNPA
jgi:2-C-methyl-D-erythritol 4-phosphate cytidylyltransferase